MLRQALIVAGGAGTRLRPSEPDRPKVLVEVGGEPLLARHLRLLATHGIKEAIMTVGYRSDQIASWLDAHAPPVPRCTVWSEAVPMGTAGGLANLARRLQDTFVVLYGDVLADVDLGRLAAFHREHGAAATLVAHPNAHPEDSDLIDAAEDGRIRRLVPAASRAREDYRNLVSAAMYVLEPSAIRHVRTASKQDFVRDLFPAMLEAGEKLYAYRTPEYLKDMGTPARLGAVRADAASGRPEACRWNRPRPAVFLDRDGTLTRARGEIVSPASLALVRGAARAVRELNRAGVLVVLTTNQPMVAKGSLTRDGLEAIHARLETLLGREGAYIDAIRFCPHHPERGFVGEIRELKITCRCRKPAPGMIEEAMRELPVDSERSVVVGDSWRDVLAARAAGVPSIGVRTGEGFDGPEGEAAPEHVVDDLAGAVELFLAPEGPGRLDSKSRPADRLQPLVRAGNRDS